MPGLCSPPGHSACGGADIHWCLLLETGCFPRQLICLFVSGNAAVRRYPLQRDLWLWSLVETLSRRAQIAAPIGDPG